MAGRLSLNHGRRNLGPARLRRRNNVFNGDFDNIGTAVLVRIKFRKRRLCSVSEPGKSQNHIYIGGLPLSLCEKQWLEEEGSGLEQDPATFLLESIISTE